MSFEKITKSRTTETSIEEEKPPERIHNLRHVGGALIDVGRRISYPLALLGTFFAYEAAHGVEIPRDATREAGVNLMREGALSEDFETAASFITLPDGSTVWYSVEGSTDEVDRYSKYSGSFNEKLVGFLADVISKQGVSKNENIRIDNYHTHPWKSYIVKYNLPEEFKLGPHFSIPPSGYGFLEGWADTSIDRHEVVETAVEKVAKELGVSASFHEHVVDAQGQWTFSFQNRREVEKNPVFLARQQTETPTHRLESTSTTKEESKAVAGALDSYTRASRIVHGALEGLDRSRNEWIDMSREGAVSNEAYQNLTKSFKNVGVTISYEAFKKR